MEKCDPSYGFPMMTENVSVNTECRKYSMQQDDEMRKILECFHYPWSVVKSKRNSQSENSREETPARHIKYGFVWDTTQETVGCVLPTLGGTRGKTEREVILILPRSIGVRNGWQTRLDDGTVKHHEEG